MNTDKGHWLEWTHTADEVREAIDADPVDKQFFIELRERFGRLKYIRSRVHEHTRTNN